jgi:GNAT superfamily N-acetyltransferase
MWVREDTRVPQTIQTRVVPGDDPTALALVAAMVAELEIAYPGRSLADSSSATPEELSGPDGAYVVLVADGAPLAGGGLKRLGPGLAEVKRMYVTPQAGRQGHAGVLLAALEDVARSLGYARIRLDTGPHTPAAERLYRGAGYTAIPDYNGNAYAVFWGEKTL